MTSLHHIIIPLNDIHREHGAKKLKKVKEGSHALLLDDKQKIEMKLVNIRHDHEEEGLRKAKVEEEEKLAQNRQKYEEMLMSIRVECRKLKGKNLLLETSANKLKLVERELRKSEDKLALNISLARSEIGEYKEK